MAKIYYFDRDDKNLNTRIQQCGILQVPNLVSNI